MPSARAAPEFKTPDWVKNAIFYQIMTDRFRNGDPSNDPVGDGNSGDLLLKEWTTLGGVTYPNLYAKKMNWTDDVETNIRWANETAPTLGRDYFGGDFKGILDKLPYLKDLGITAIYFNPIHEGPHTHGYTIDDYKSVKRYFGGMEAFRQLMNALDQEGIRVVLDGVFNHCSVKNFFFDRESSWETLGAYESQSSEWYSWFTFYTWPKEYARWGGFYHLPELNETDAYKQYVYRGGYTGWDTDPQKRSVIQFWNELGVDGWRLDVANEVSHDFWKEFRTYYKQLNPDGYLVGEIWYIQPEYLRGDEFDGLMNYPWRQAVINWLKGGSPSKFDSDLKNIKNAYPAEAFYALLNHLSTHDTNRIRSEVGGNWAKAKLAVIFQMTYPGVPCIYYGDEVGMTNDYPRGSNTLTRADPFNRRPYPWKDQGYPVPEQPDVPNDDLLDLYKKMTNIRRSHQVLRTGTVETLLTDDSKNIYALLRRLPNPELEDYANYPEAYAVLVYNNGTSAQTVTLDLTGKLPAGTQLTDVLNGGSYTVSGSLQLTVEGLWADILVSTPANQPPVAMFTFTPESPTTTEEVQFTDSSRDPDGRIVSWNWDFGDGTTSSEQNPTHLFPAEGQYTVTLTVTDDRGATQSYSLTISVSSAGGPAGIGTSLTLVPSTLSLVPGQSLQLSATLKEEGGSPLASKSLRWSTTVGTLSQRATLTDANGQASVVYTAPGVSADTQVVITVSFDGEGSYRPCTKSILGTIRVLRQPTSVRVDLKEIPEKVPPDFVVKGRVEDNLGNPVVGAEVRVFVNGREASRAVTGGNGSFMAPIRMREGRNVIEWQVYTAGGLLTYGQRTVNCELPAEEGEARPALPTLPIIAVALLAFGLSYLFGRLRG
ncbi:MAG: alpha-amylase family glycosyl hydrolase [Candidatus Hadarchaeales archaeon]